MCGSLTLFFANSDMILKPEATKLHPLLERRSIRVSFVDVTSSRKYIFKGHLTSILHRARRKENGLISIIFVSKQSRLSVLIIVI